MSEKRFELINRDPIVCSSVKRCKGAQNFGLMKARSGKLWKTSVGQTPFVSPPEKKMNMTQGPSMSKSLGRKPFVVNTWHSLSSVDDKKVYDAENNMLKRRACAFTNFKKTKPRDDAMWKDTDRLHNQQLDWGREEREREIAQRSHRNRAQFLQTY